MKLSSLLFVLALFSATAIAQQTMRPDGRGGWVIQNGPDFSAWGRTPGTQYEIDQQNARLREEQIRNQQLQNQLLRDQQLQNEQIRNQQIENERLRRQLEQERSAAPAKP